VTETTTGPAYVVVFRFWAKKRYWAYKIGYHHDFEVGLYTKC